MKVERDPCLDTLLLLDGEVFVTEGKFRVKFDVKEVRQRRRSRTA